MKSLHRPATALLLASTLALLGCPDGSTNVEDVITAILTHEDGFDFSENAPDATFTTYDGDVIAWQPGNAENPDYPSGNTIYLWWRNDHLSTSQLNQTIDMGEVELSSVTSAPSSWEASPNITPLLVGHVYVARCADGYVKFKVKSLDTTNWTATVDFVYSTSSSFGG